MNKDQISEVVGKALRSYNWGTGKSLPDYIAHLIVSEQALEDPTVTTSVHTYGDSGDTAYVKLRNDCDALRKECAEKEQHKDELRDEIKRLGDDRCLFIAQRDKLRVEIKDAAKTLNDRDAEILNLRGLNRLYGEEMDKRKAEIAALRKEIRQHLDAIERLTKDRSEMKGRLEEARAEVAVDWKQRALDAERDLSLTEQRRKEAIFRADALDKEGRETRAKLAKAEIEAKNAAAVVKLAQARAAKAEMSLQDAHQMHDHEVDARIEMQHQLKDMTFRAEVAEKRADTHEATIAAIKGAMR